MMMHGRFIYSQFNTYTLNLSQDRIFFMKASELPAK